MFYVSGRRALAEFASSLNMALSHIQASTTALLRTEKNLHFVLGYLVTPLFLDTLAHDFDEKLSQEGLISLDGLSKTVDLPGEFLQDQMLKRVGKIIMGQKDPEEIGMIYTQDFIDRHTALIRGILTGVTKPYAINSVMKKVPDVPEKLFFRKLFSCTIE